MMATNIGILDPTGKNPNPLTNEPYSDEYKRLAKDWSSLPAYKDRLNIIKDIKQNQVILIISGTGSGKTVLMPKFVLHSLNYKGKIAITLPKQIVTKSSAQYAAATLDVKLGTHVGYKYKGSPKEARSTETKLLYATDGTIVQKLLQDPSLSEFDAVLIDEAHERSVQIDILLFLLKENTLKLRPEFKLIIMSATVNESIFANYFSEFKFKTLNISGKTNYPIESIYLTSPIGLRYVDKGLEIVKKIINGKKRGDVLFFVTSSSEAIDFCRKLAEISKDISGKPFCIEVYSGISGKKEVLATNKDEYKKQGFDIKIAVSTNVAESSLTIDGIKYVIDSGYELLSSYDPNSRGKRLDKLRTSKAQVKQRMGRAGRTSAGTCYHLYTKEEHKQFVDYPEPNIRREDITLELLGMLLMDKVGGSVENLLQSLKKMIEPPKKSHVQASMSILNKLGLIQDNKVTKKGEIVKKISESDVFMGNCLFYSYFYKCSREMSMIIGLLISGKNSVRNIFIKTKNRKKKDKAKDKFRDSSGDHISLLNIMDGFKNAKDRRKWCEQNFLKYKILDKSLHSAKRTRHNLMRTMQQFNIDAQLDKLGDQFGEQENIHQDLDINKRIIQCLILGLKTKKATLDKGGRTYTTRYVDRVEFSRDSYLKKKPKTIVYTELFMQGKDKKLNIITKIN